MNSAYITKLGLQLVSNPNKNWVQLVRSKYLRERWILDFQQTTQASRKCYCSLWNGVCIKVGCNSTARIYEDPWIPKASNFKVPDGTLRSDDFTLVRDLMNEVGQIGTGPR